MTLIDFSTAEVLRFAVVLFRVSGIMLFAPFFSSPSFSLQIRVVFTLVTTLALAHALPLGALPDNLSLGNLATLVLSESLFGMVLGLAASFIFAGMQFAGQLISFQIGFSLINMIDPQSQIESPIFSFIQNYIGLLFFLLLNGHHWFFLTVSESFGYIPVGGVQLQGPLVEQIIQLSTQILVIGFKIAGPVIAVSVISDVVMGIIGRAAPQIHILIIGLPVKVLVGISCLSFSIYFLPRFLEETYSALYKMLYALMHMMA